LQAGAARGEGAGFVQGDVAQAVGRFQHAAAFEQQPLRAAAVRLLTMVIGVDSTRAQGQAMTSKASAW